MQKSKAITGKPLAKSKRAQPAQAVSRTNPKIGRTRGRPDPAEAVGSEGLIQTALEMLREMGPAAVTRASLARRANVAPGLIRYYFSNRDSLIRAATLELHKAQQKRASELAEQEDLSPADRICARALALLDFKLANPFYHHLILEELANSSSPESRNRFHEIASQSIERYRRYLKEGAEDGSLREVDPGFLYLVIISFSEFVVHAGPLLHKELGVGSDEELREGYGAFICDILLNGLRPR